MIGLPGTHKRVELVEVKLGTIGVSKYDHILVNKH